MRAEDHAGRALFYRQLATSLGAGISGREAIDLLARDRTAAGDRARAVQARFADPSLDLGDLLAATETHPVVGPARAAVLRNAWQAGKMVEALQSLARDAEDANQARKRLRSALLRPTILAVSAAVIPNIPLVVTSGVIPYLLATLPWIALIIALLSVIGGSGRRLAGVPRGVPLIGPLAREQALARSNLVLHHYFHAGLSPWDALQGAAQAAGPGPEAGEFRRVARKVQGGSSLAEAMAESNLPPVMVGFLRTGEKSGNLSEMAKLAHTQHREKAEAQMTRVLRFLAFLAFAVSMTVAALQVFDFWTGHFESVMEISE